MNENIVFNELTPAEQENLSGGSHLGGKRGRSGGVEINAGVIGNVNLGKNINAIGFTNRRPATRVVVTRPALHPKGGY